MTLTYLVKNKIALALVVCGLLLFPITTIAQNSVSLTVSPAIFEMGANPGQIWESKLRVINNNPFELTVYAQVVNFRPLGEDGSSQFIPINTEDGVEDTLGEWINVPDTAIIIPPEETIELPVKIILPDNAPPGGHYAAIMVGTRPPTNNEESLRVETSQLVSSLIFLRVSGDVIEQGNIRGFRALNGLVESPEATFELRFENTGNVHLRPEGEIRIYNMWGQERGVIPVNKQTLFGNILSESVRSFNFTWQGEWSPVDIGRYTAEATLAYGDSGRQFTAATASFWLIPWRILLGIVLSLALVIITLAWLVRLYVRRMFAIAGLENQNPLQRKLAVERKREVSVVAPIETGILDLRSRLSDGRVNRFNAIVDYISEYRMFFVGLLIVGIIFYVVSWFVGSVSEEDRAFEITVSGGAGAVTVDSESLKYQEQQTTTVAAKRDIPPLTMVNRSGITGAAADVALALEELGYTIESVSTELNASDAQTVIVYDPALEEEALELSAVLDNALLSAFPATETEQVTLTIYVGSNLSN